LSVTIGAQLGSHELIGLLGKGEVYRARDLKLKREVAIKILPDLSRHPDRVRRFEREAEVLAAQSSEHCRDLRPSRSEWLALSRP
jgi:eukaryotic-like serine/threonine-protein kinase